MEASKLTPSEYKAIQLETKKRKITQDNRSDAALKTMMVQWENATKPCVTHTYFDRKLLTISEEDGLRLDPYGNILCPVRLITGEVVSTQTIPAQGKKRFYTGLSSKNGFHIFSTIEPDKDIYFAEGVATAKIINESIKKPVICV